MKEEIIIVTCLVIIFIGGCVVGWMLGDAGVKIDLFKEHPKTNNSSNCSGLDLEDTAQCLKDYVTSIYKYNLTPDSWELTLDELIERGGDCKDWTTLYISLAEEVGYKATYHRFDVKGNRGHRYAVINDETGYCVLDQTKIVGCGHFSLAEETKEPEPIVIELNRNITHEETR